MKQDVERINNLNAYSLIGRIHLRGYGNGLSLPVMRERWGRMHYMFVNLRACTKYNWVGNHPSYPLFCSYATGPSNVLQFF